jgi:hypothetical protein
MIPFDVLARSVRSVILVMVVSTVAAAVFPTASFSQSLQFGIAGAIGSGGVGGELDVASRRVGMYARFQRGLSNGTQSAGTRVYFVGERSSAFYVSAAWVGLRCAKIRVGGVATNCDGKWHNAWSLLGGVEMSVSPNTWSLYLDAGPYFGAREEPGLPDWAFTVGARIRAP